MRFFAIIFGLLHIFFVNLLVFAFIIFFSPLILLVFFFRITRVLSFSEGSAIFALIPGMVGILSRRIWYKMNLKRCGKNLNTGWMSVIRNVEAEIGNNVFIGPFCWICRARIGNDTMIAGHCRVLSGMQQHYTSRIDIPMRMQKGAFETISIGNDCWVGVGSIVMADIAPGSIVAAGSVVTKTFEPYAKLGGGPARLIGTRKDNSLNDVDCME